MNCGIPVPKRSFQKGPVREEKEKPMRNRPLKNNIGEANIAHKRMHGKMLRHFAMPEDISLLNYVKSGAPTPQLRIQEGRCAKIR
jgi:hypothetical protein